MGRRRQCHASVGRTMKLDCTPAPIPPKLKSSLRPHREPQGVGSPIGKAKNLCGRLVRPPRLDTVGNRGFSGAAKAARGHAPQGMPALILMGDWCAAAQPMFENQVCKQLAGCKATDLRASKLGLKSRRRRGAESVRARKASQYADHGCKRSNAALAAIR
jgi:hypothetical protein